MNKQFPSIPQKIIILTSPKRGALTEADRETHDPPDEWRSLIGLGTEVGDLEAFLVPLDELLSSIVLIAPKVAPVGVRPLCTLMRPLPSTAESTDISAEPSGWATLYD